MAAPMIVYMAVFFLVPTLMLFVYSFWTAALYQIVPAFQFGNYIASLTSETFWITTANSLRIGFLTASITLILAIPVGYYLVYVTRSNVILYLILLTWFSSYLVRIYAWRTLLGTNGVINTFLLQAGVISEPIDAFLFNSFAVTITLIHVYLPYSILLVVASFSEIKPELIDAARDLGCSTIGAFFRLILPNAVNGMIGAFMLTFILAAGDYVTPQMLGGSSGQTTGLLIADQFRKTGNWPLGAAQAFLIFAISVLVYVSLVVIGRLSGVIVKRRAPARTEIA